MSIMNNTLMYKFFLWMHVFISLDFIPWSGIAGAYGNFTFNFLKKLPGCFPKFLHCYVFQ